MVSGNPIRSHQVLELYRELIVNCYVRVNDFFGCVPNGSGGGGFLVSFTPKNESSIIDRDSSCLNSGDSKTPARTLA